MLVRNDMQEGVVVALLGKPPDQYNCVMVMAPEGKYELQLRSDETHCKNILDDGHPIPYEAGERKTMQTSGHVRFILLREQGTQVVTHWAYV